MHDDSSHANVPFADRTDAGRLLAGKLAAYRGRDDVVVLALPRGGVPVALEVARALGAPLDLLIAAEGVDLIRRLALYFDNHEAVPIEGRTVMVVDDGVATGASMRAALAFLRGARPAWIVVAVPVAPPNAQDLIGTAADDLACVLSPSDFQSLGSYYRDFTRISDEQVRDLLARPRAS
jgi:putative phosphoribosyl transferase